MIALSDAYTSTNKALRALWVSVSGLPPESMILRRPGSATSAVIPGLSVTWLARGTPTGTTGETAATLQLSVFVGEDAEATANLWADGLTAGLGLTSGGRFEVWNHDPDAPCRAGTAAVEALEGGWVTLNDPDPSVVHLALTLDLTYTPLAG